MKRGKQTPLRKKYEGTNPKTCHVPRRHDSFPRRFGNSCTITIHSLLHLTLFDDKLQSSHVPQVFLTCAEVGTLDAYWILIRLK